jgi:hypothetical protein
MMSDYNVMDLIKLSAEQKPIDFEQAFLNTKKMPLNKRKLLRLILTIMNKKTQN